MTFSALLTDMQDQAKLAPLMPVGVRKRLPVALAHLEVMLAAEVARNPNASGFARRLRAEVMPQEPAR